MQTFMPEPLDFDSCAVVLDNRRLGKQRVEALQILHALTTPDYGWQNHPAVRMWRGYTRALKEYYNCMLNEWEQRGFRNLKLKYFYQSTRRIEYPPWLTVPNLKYTHRANLLRKDPVYYGRFKWEVTTMNGYWWPYTRVHGRWRCNFIKGRTI